MANWYPNLDEPQELKNYEARPFVVRLMDGAAFAGAGLLGIVGVWLLLVIVGAFA